MLPLPKGLNFVLGSGGSGKTNLWKAFCFAVTGHFHDRFAPPLNRVINHRHREETLTPSCRVEVEFSHEGRKWSAASSLSITGEKIAQSHTADLGIHKLEIYRNPKIIYIDPENLADKFNEKYKNWSPGNRWAHAITRDLTRNSENGIKAAVIDDGSFERLDPEHTEAIFNLVDDLRLEQVTVMTWRLPDNIEKHPCSIHHIEYDHKSDRLEVLSRKHIC